MTGWCLKNHPQQCTVKHHREVMTNQCFLCLMAWIARYFKNKINRIPICLTRERKIWGIFSWLFFFSWDVKDLIQIFSSLVYYVVPEAWLNMLGSNVVNTRRAESTIPSHSFQGDLFISIKESCKGIGQKSSWLSEEYAHQDTGLLELQIFYIKIKTVSIYYRQNKKKRSHVDSESPSEFILKTWPSHPVTQTCSHVSSLGMRTGGGLVSGLHKGHEDSAWG